MDDPGPDFILAQFMTLAENSAKSGIGTDLLIKIPLLLVLILVNAFFAMAEIAVISLNDAKIEKMENGYEISYCDNRSGIIVNNKTGKCSEIYRGNFEYYAE